MQQPELRVGFGLGSYKSQRVLFHRLLYYNPVHPAAVSKSLSAHKLITVHTN